MEQVKRLSKTGWRWLAVGSGLVSLALIWPLVTLFHGHLPLWAHLPLAAVLMTVFGGGALLAGVAWLNSQWGPPAGR